MVKVNIHLNKTVKFQSISLYRIQFFVLNLWVLRMQPGKHQANGFYYSLDFDLDFHVMVTYYENTW